MENFYESLQLYKILYAAAVRGGGQLPDTIAREGVKDFFNYKKELETPKQPEVYIKRSDISTRLRSNLWLAGFLSHEGLIDVSGLAAFNRAYFEKLRNMGPKTMLELDKLFETLNIKYL